MVSLRARRREILGKKTKKLRREGFVPAVLVERGQPSIPILLERAHFLEVFKDVGESSFVDFELDSERFKAIVSEVQCDPVSGELVHVGFQKIRRGEKISTAVPVKFIGESLVIERGDGILLTLLDELEVRCLPQDLPAEIELDISRLKKVGDALTVKDLSLDLGKVGLIGRSEEDLVVKVAEPKMAEVEETFGMPIEEEEEVSGVDEEGEEAEGSSSEVEEA